MQQAHPDQTENVGCFATDARVGWDTFSMLGWRRAFCIILAIPGGFILLWPFVALVHELILHQKGNDLPMRRLSDSEIEKMADDVSAKAAFAAKRYKDQKVQAGSDEALRRLLRELRAGDAKYDQMTLKVSQSTRQQGAV